MCIDKGRIGEKNNILEAVLMKKTAAIIVALSLALSVGSAFSYAEAAVLTIAEAKASVSFRDQPSTSSNVMRYLKVGEDVTVLGMIDPYWYQIKDANGVTGYVSSSDKYVQMLSNANVIYGVNMRTGPSSDASVIRMLAKGESLLILEKVNDSWYKAKDSKGVIGYLSTSSKYTVTDFSIAPIELPLADKIEAVIAEANKYMGVPYLFSSERFNPSSFDCSDFVQQARWDATKVVLPGDSRGQGDYVKEHSTITTDWRELKRGDLLFFMSYQGSGASSYSNVDRLNETITHVGIYLGDGQMLHTYSPESGGVRIDTIAGKQWELRFLFGGSPMN
jgi:cell wall-associated NlpC family hydrolase